MLGLTRIYEKAKMKKEKRTLEEVQKEYSQMCMQLGDLEYKMAVTLPEAIRLLQNKIRELNKEASKIENPKS